jgi:sulfate/thiosulfate transport system ATP-binding protein
MRISVRNIVVAFDGEAAPPALAGVSLDVLGGELVALLGPSGSGKTTLLRVIAGLEFPNAGSVFFGEENASNLTVQERKVGFVFQSYALFKHMSVLENIAFGLDVRPRSARPPKAEIRRRANELLELVQLSGLGDRMPNQLSGGQRQRVALARALAVEPRVLLLDEPFGALDARVRRDLRRWLREIHDRTGHTTIFVTHDQDEALEVADRVAILNKGRIEQVGAPDQIYDHPATEFVHRFIGEPAALDVRVAAGRVYVGGQPIDMPAPPEVNGDALLFLRPHDVELAADGAAGLSARIVSARRAGSARRAEIRIAGAERPIEISAPATIPFAPGDRVAVRIVGGRVYSAG